MSNKLSSHMAWVSGAAVTGVGFLMLGVLLGTRLAEAEQAMQAPLPKPVAQPSNLVIDRVIDPPLALKHEVRLFIDERTGCHYLVAGGVFQPVTMMARRYSDGVQVCDEH